MEETRPALAAAPRANPALTAVPRENPAREPDARYTAAAAVLPTRLRRAALSLDGARQAAAEEFRLRAGQPLSVVLPGGEFYFDTVVTPEELETLCDIASEFSRYAAAETLRDGFLPVRGGFRLGLCGTAVMKDGVNTNLKALSSAVLRIGRERKDAGETAAPHLFRDGVFQNTLLLSPPGGGKTTLLRDLVRRISSGVEGNAPRRVALLDERGEVAVMYRGRAQMDVGPRTDVLDGCPKALGIPMVLRAMSPEVIAADEITAREDIRAMVLACGCGVGLLATVHAGSVGELSSRPLYRELLEEKVFAQTVRIHREGGARRYEVETL